MQATRPWSARGPLILAAAVSAVLLSTVLLTTRTVAQARDGAARGVGDGFVIAGREHLRRPARLDADALAAFLDEHADDGLRYVAVVGGDGAIAAEAGAPRSAETRPGLYVLGDRVRLVQPTATRSRRQTARRAAAGAGGGAAAMIYEYEPLIANQLGADARWLTIAAIAASVAVIGLAAWVSRGLRARERLQRELEQRRRLAALGEMSAVLAHELRNPLASLKGHAQLLVEILDDPADAAAARTKAERVVAESVRLETLTTDLLDYVRTGTIHRAPVAPAALVADAAAEVDAARIDVDAAAAPDTWPVDAAHLRQALVNVLRNAVQASPDGARVTATVDVDGDRLVITIRDRGAGIPRDELAAIFEPFHTRRVRGVGLGLAIARRAVELHGGRIDAKNHPDGGAVLELAVPRSG
jgi:two-component system, NtrC family, sensor histidine kinase HydH